MTAAACPVLMQSLMQRTVFRQDLEKVLGVFAKSKCPDNDIHHLIGNHDLYNFTRSDPRLKALFRKSESGTYYYSFSPAHGWKFIVLDPFDISTIDPAHGSAEDAWELLKKHNQNDVRDDKGDWYKDLEGDAKRWVPPNGALSTPPLSLASFSMHRPVLDRETSAAFALSAAIFFGTRCAMQCPVLTSVWSPRDQVSSSCDGWNRSSRGLKIGASGSCF